MNFLVPVTLFGSILVFMILAAFLPKRRALIASILGAWLFLPIATYDLPGLPDYDKLFATCFGVLVAFFLFDFRRFLSFRPSWYDIPVIVWCLVPIASSLSNAEGIPVNPFYDGVSEALEQSIKWGVPYLIGRVYFTDWEELKELAMGLILSGLVYTPFILFEMRLSPQLHRIVYGYHQHLFNQTRRFGLWRPMVFMNHGLMASFYIMAIAITSVWIWWTGAIKRIWKIPFVFIAALFSGLTVLMVSVNSWTWFILGLTVLVTCYFFRSAVPLILLMLFVPVYTLLQGSSVWPADTAVSFATGVLGPDRAQSLEYRYFNEEKLTEKARERWLFGWAGWDRQQVVEEWGGRTVADSLWIIVFGKFGVVGLVSLMMSLFLPGILFVWRYPPWLWGNEHVAVPAAFTVILVLYMFDGLLNAMINPIYMMMAGGLMSATLSAVARNRTLPTFDFNRDDDDPRSSEPTWVPEGA